MGRPQLDDSNNKTAVARTAHARCIGCCGVSAEQSIAAAVVQHALGLLTSIIPGLLLLWIDRGQERIVATNIRFTQGGGKRVDCDKGSRVR